jgi:hypothetical protein
MQCAVCVDATCATVTYVLTVSIMCTDKQDLISVKLNLNEFCHISVADRFVFVLLLTLYCSTLDC